MTVAGRVGSGTGEARDGKATATCILDMLRGSSVSDGLFLSIRDLSGDHLVCQWRSHRLHLAF